MFTYIYQTCIPAFPTGLVKTSSELLAQLTLFRIGFAGAAHGWGAKKDPLPKICHTYPTIMKLGIVIPYLKKFQKLYESHDTPLGFC